MNLSYSLILAFVGIAGPTSAGPTSDEPTSIFVPFENDLNTLSNEVIKYCDDPAKYDKTSLKESVYGPIKDWDVSALTSMYGLFSPDICPSCRSCNPPVSNWNVSAVILFDFMFYGAEEFNQDLSGWDVRKGHSFVSLRWIRLVWYDACSHSSLLYCNIYNSIRLSNRCFVGRGCLTRI